MANSGLDLAALVDEQRGLVSMKAYADQDVFRVEQERVFGRAWLYVGHESEVPRNGDYVTRQMSQDPVILVRDNHGKLRVFLNMCPHRGALILRSEAGNAPSYVCPYHGWTYENTGRLLATCHAAGLYEGLDTQHKQRLVEARVDSYAGLVFATFNEALGSLGDYLGDARWYLDLYHARTPGGMVVLGPPHKWVVNGNWKLGAANFGADGPHATKVHGPISRLSFGDFEGAQEALFQALEHGPAIVMGNGHNGTTSLSPEPIPEFLGRPPECVPLYHQALSPGQLKIVARNFAGVQTIFPNFSSVEGPGRTDLAQPPACFLNIRVWQPIAPDRTEIWGWFLAEKEASEEWKAMTMRSGLRTFSFAGTFDQDDAEVWASIGCATRGAVAQREAASFEMVQHYRGQLVTDYPGPGKVYPTIWSEVGEFEILRHWYRLMNTA